MVYIILRFLSYLIFKIFFRLEVRGRENIPGQGGFILASNHVSYLDPIGLGVASPRKLKYLARDDLFRGRFFSWLMFSVRAFPIKRGSADFSALKGAIRQLREGEPLVLFPEGTRRKPGELSGKALAGVAFLAVKTAVPVIPAFVKGTEEALPKGAKRARFKKVCIYFGREIQIDKEMSYQDTAQLIMQRIEELSSCAKVKIPDKGGVC